MVKASKDVTAAELAILEQLWQHGSLTLKQLSRSLYGAETASDIATVQKLISRLEAKGCVSRDREQWPHLFQAIIARNELITQRLQATADELCDGTMSTLLTHLVRSKKFSAKQRQNLRDLLDEMEPK